jgi:hypothetical protein
MARIDLYINSIQRFGATGAVLTSNAPVTLRFPQGDRAAAQQTPHGDLVAIVDEIQARASASVWPGQRLTLNHPSGGRAWSIHVDATGPTAWKLTIEPQGGAPVQPAPVAPAAAFTPPPAPPGEDLAIERTS